MLFQYTHLPPSTIRLLSFTQSSTPADIKLIYIHHSLDETSPQSFTVLALATPPVPSPYTTSAQRTQKSVTVNGRARLLEDSVWTALHDFANYEVAATSNGVTETEKSRCLPTKFFLAPLCINHNNPAEVQSHAALNSRINHAAHRIVLSLGNRSSNDDGKEFHEVMARRQIECRKHEGIMLVTECLDLSKDRETMQKVVFLVGGKMIEADSPGEDFLQESAGKEARARNFHGNAKV